jgi:DNA-binding protein
VVVIRRAFIVTLFQGECCAKLHTSVGEVVDEVEIKTREVVVCTGGRAIVRAVDSVFRVPVSQESTTMPPFFDKVMVADSRGVRVGTYIDCDESIRHHITQDSEVEAESTIRLKRTPDRDERVVVWMTSNPKLLSEVRR